MQVFCREVNILARVAKDIITTTARNMRIVEQELVG
jgi:hypothetical protein